MEKVFSQVELDLDWKKESRSRVNFGWWFDLDNEYTSDMRLGGNTPIICDEGPQEIEDLEIKDSLCMLLLRKSDIVVVGIQARHEFKIISNKKEAFVLKSQLTQPKLYGGDSWVIDIVNKELANKGLITLFKDYLNGFRVFSLEMVSVDPTIKTLAEWGLLFTVSKKVTEMAEELVRNLV